MRIICFPDIPTHLLRRIVLLCTIAGLLVAPLIVILTHGPSPHATQHSLIGSLFNHAHPHGPGDDLTPSDFFNMHNAVDHDHQLYAVVTPTQMTEGIPPVQMRYQWTDSFRYLVPEGPKRPPRFV